MYTLNFGKHKKFQLQQFDWWQISEIFLKNFKSLRKICSKNFPKTFFPPATCQWDKVSRVRTTRWLMSGSTTTVIIHKFNFVDRRIELVCYWKCSCFSKCPMNSGSAGRVQLMTRVARFECSSNPANFRRRCSRGNAWWRNKLHSCHVPRAAMTEAHHLQLTNFRSGPSAAAIGWVCRGLPLHKRRDTWENSANYHFKI